MTILELNGAGNRMSLNNDLIQFIKPMKSIILPLLTYWNWLLEVINYLLVLNLNKNGKLFNLHFKTYL